jgi:hypothetical protein
MTTETAAASPMSRSRAAAAPDPRGLIARYGNAYRLAAYLMVLYTLGHTFGAVIATPKFGAESDAVVTAMKTVHVTAQGADCTWYGFYRGFGAFVSLFFMFSTMMAWHLGGKTVEDRHAFAPITWALVLTWAAGVALAWEYFFAAPVVFSTLITLILGGACVKDWRVTASSRRFA